MTADDHPDIYFLEEVIPQSFLEEKLPSYELISGFKVTKYFIIQLLFPGIETFTHSAFSISPFTLHSLNILDIFTVYQLNMIFFVLCFYSGLTLFPAISSYKPICCLHAFSL